MNRAGLGCVAAGTVVVSLARAEAPAPTPARLEYDRAAGGPTCPEVSFFRDVVAAHFGGHDPFTPDASRRITLTVRRQEQRSFVVDAVMYGPAGERLGSRQLVAANCTEVVEAMSVTMLHWLRPFELPEPPPSQPPGPATPALPPPSPATPPTLTTPKPAMPVAQSRQASALPKPRPAVVVDLGPHLSLTTLPGQVSPGFAIGVGVRWPVFSLSIEAAADAPTSAALEPFPRQARVGLVLGALAPCLHVGRFVGCALVSGGVLTSEGLRASLRTARWGYAAAGARVGVELPVARHVALRLAGDVLVPALRPKATLGAVEVWTVPPVNEVLSGRAIVSF